MKLYFIDQYDLHSSKYLLECTSECVPRKGEKIDIIREGVNFTGEVIKIHWEYGARDKMDAPELWANVYCLGSHF